MERKRPDGSAATETLLAHGAWARALARHLVADPGAADDLEQDTWLAAVASPPAAGTGRGWIATVMRRLAARRRRAAARRDERERAAARPVAEEAAADVAARAEAHRRVVEAVSRLEEPYRTAVLLRFFDGLPPAAVAARLGVPVETARTRVRRGVERLRARLGGPEGARAALAPLVPGGVAGDGAQARSADGRGSSPRGREILMRTGTFVASTAFAGVLGGVVGAVVFLTWFADGRGGTGGDGAGGRGGGTAVRPAAAPAGMSPAEAESLAALARRVDGLEATVTALSAAVRRAEALRAAPAADGVPPRGSEKPAAPDLEAEIARNELRAIATLRNLTSCQAQVQVSGKIDVDGDGIGECGTFLELSGGTGVRAGSDGAGGADFGRQGDPIDPAILSHAFRAIDGSGRVTRNGYVYQLFLPDTAAPAGFVHEAGSAAAPGLAGGTGRVATDLAETTWCMYAWPVKHGETGRRRFFVNQAGDVLQSPNEAKRDGMAEVDPRGAFLGDGITSRVAVGVRGRDGEIWKVAN